MMDRMRHAAMVFGVTDESQAVVEALYLELLDTLNAHFETHPYLLGAKPCLGDFGLIAPCMHTWARSLSGSTHAATRNVCFSLGRTDEPPR